MADWPALLSRDLATQGAALALADASGELSRADLDNRVRLWSAFLARKNLLPGDRVLLLLPHGVDSWVAMLAALALGTTVIPVSPGLPGAEIRHLVRTWRPAACLVTEAGPEIGLDPEQVISLESLPRKWPRQRNPGSLGSDAVLRFATRGQVLLPGGPLPGEAGCLHGIEAILANARRLVSTLALAPGLAGLLALPVGHWAGLVLGLGLLDAGRTIWLVDPDGSLPAPEDGGLFACFTTLAHWRRGLARPDPPGAGPAIRHLVAMAGIVSRELLRQTRCRIGAAPVDLVYGTPMHLAATRLRIEAEVPAPGCIGHPLPGAGLRIMRRPMQAARPGQAGYLVHAGDGGIACRPGREGPLSPAGETPFDQQEIGWQDEEGRLFRLPSPKDLIRTAGHVLAPEALEQQILDSGLVEDAFAFGVPHPDLQEAVVLVVVARPRVTPHQLRQFCRETLPDFMVPHRIELHARLPALSLARSGRHYLRLRYAGFYGEVPTSYPGSALRGPACR
ncbi:MAG: class I adenylate-forming enzyme family protein [Beijerinckiaceae bacterium]|jgi:acyl-coenzyme A synthetase/AMP-(fatty) acid ligase|nr:class I adenylate-forming enzyme family protein [Beijerinckiaceae bacterium]